MLRVRTAAAAILTLAILAAGPGTEARDTFYIAPSQVRLIEILEPPPAPDSEAQRHDIEAVLGAQQHRIGHQEEDARTDSSMSLFVFVGATLGPAFKRENLAITAPFFEQVFVDQFEAARGTKEHFNRPRPSAVEPRVKPVVRQPPSPSYPSGHAMTGYVYATILSIMVPEKSRELYRRAAEYGRNRVIAGVHFPTDIESARVSAAVIVNALLQQPLFVRDFERARAEVRRVMDLNQDVRFFGPSYRQPPPDP